MDYGQNASSAIIFNQHYIILNEGDHLGKFLCLKYTCSEISYERDISVISCIHSLSVKYFCLSSISKDSVVSPLFKIPIGHSALLPATQLTHYTSTMLYR